MPGKSSYFALVHRTLVLGALAFCLALVSLLSPEARGQSASAKATVGGRECSAPDDPFGSFDFEAGSKFPARSTIRIDNVEVSSGAKVAKVRVALDRPTPNTVIARVRTRNGGGNRAAVQGRDFELVDRYLFFRPGDPLCQLVSIPLRQMEEGEQFELVFPEGVTGAKVSGRSGGIEAVSAAKRSPALSGSFRATRDFTPQGEPDFELDAGRAQWSDGGGADRWSTRLPHGRTQPGNKEVGLYLDPELHRTGAPSIEARDGKLVLRGQKLETPIRYDGRAWSYGAAVLSAQKLSEAHLEYGQIEWVAQMPDQRGSWPALWLLSTKGWPPEIDVYEGFGYSPNWKFARNISANIHGGNNNQRSFTRLMQVDAKRAYGLDGFDREFHRFAVDIQPDYITWFVDGKEVYQTLNPFPGERWFPLMTVAVKDPRDFQDKPAEMVIRSMKVWRE